ncbi:endocytosis, partial [Pristimantis euphronides]
MYSVSSGTTTMCWGRGHCPYSKCNSEILWTDGSRVTRRTSDKYQLMGDIEAGNVTLTITGVTSEDAGTYCCRVEIPGIFNDQKLEINVEIKEDSLVNISLFTKSLYNCIWESRSEGSYISVFYTLLFLLVVLILLFGVLLYRNRYQEKKLSDLFYTVSTVSPREPEATQAAENVYMKI